MKPTCRQTRKTSRGIGFAFKVTKILFSALGEERGNESSMVAGIAFFAAVLMGVLSSNWFKRELDWDTEAGLLEF